MAHTDNSPTPAPPATVGFKISKPGYDANKTAGNNFVFDSSWPSLPIAFETTVSNSIVNSSSFQTIAHNQGFAGFAVGWAYYPDPSGVGNVGRRFMPMVDKNNVYINGNAPIFNRPDYSATKLKIRVFQLDLSVDIDYSLAPGDTFNMPYDPNFGVKVVKANKDINSKDMRDYALHSRCQSPLILAVKTETTLPAANITAGLNFVQYTNHTPNPVWVYGFIKAGTNLAATDSVPANTYVPADYYSQAYPSTTTDGFTSYVGYATGARPDNGATLVILRDPMFAATSQAVTY